MSTKLTADYDSGEVTIESTDSADVMFEVRRDGEYVGTVFGSDIEALAKHDIEALEYLKD